MADTSDLVKRLRERARNRTYILNDTAELLNEAADALESATTMRIEVDDAMVERFMGIYETEPHHWIDPDKVRAALTAALNPQQGKNNG